MPEATSVIPVYVLLFPDNVSVEPPLMTRAFVAAAVVPVRAPEKVAGELLLSVSVPVPSVTVPDPVRLRRDCVVLLRSSVPVMSKTEVAEKALLTPARNVPDVTAVIPV